MPLPADDLLLPLSEPQRVGPRLNIPNIPAPEEADEPLLTPDEQRMQLMLTLRRVGITDTQVLSAMEATPREAFVPETFRRQAYHDIALPIASGQTISQPSVVAWMTWALELEPRHRVLEVGTGSGYQAAVLSKLCRMVYTIERQENLHKQSREIFRELQLLNIHTRLGDGTQGWPESAPFDRIIVTAAAPEIPRIYMDQLRDGGVLLMPVGHQGEDQWLVRLTKQGESFTIQHLMPVRFVPLV